MSRVTPGVPTRDRTFSSRVVPGVPTCDREFSSRVILDVPTRALLPLLYTFHFQFPNTFALTMNIN